MQKFIVLVLFVGIASLVLFQCNKNNENEKSPFLNTHEGKAHYIGMNECKQCHATIYESFMQTGMGQSWDYATRKKSLANFSSSKAIVFDSVKNLFYKPFLQNDSLYIQEYRFIGKDTVHNRIEKVSYIVGSGQHTNSHIININGYLHQAPITFYTQKGKWDLAPGFEKGHSSGFDRKIEMECISCHNGYPQIVNESINKYTTIKTGIDCERCHGAGSIHVEEKRNGNIIDTSKMPDYSIVNPKRLDIEQQNNLCMRCHLQGISVLQNDKTFLDFKPSQHLKNTMNTFMPVYSEDENNMIMASHVERLQQSKCFIVSQKMSCITCHNPHVSVKQTPQETFNNVCKNCHAIKSQNENPNSTCFYHNSKLTSQSCIDCHMPKNKSIDIPHVAVTDHLIKIPTAQKNNTEILNKTAQFIQMKCYSNKNIDERNRAKAFLEFYERYTPNNLFLDSAIFYLQKNEIKNDLDNDLLRAYYLKQNYGKIVSMTTNLNPKKITDYWTAYRIGKSYSHLKQTAQSLLFLEQSTLLKPLALEFQCEYANELAINKNYEKATKIAEMVLNENPKIAKANFILGYIFMQKTKWQLAKIYFQKAILYNPNHVQSFINLAVCYYNLNQKQYIKPLLLQALQIEPHHEQVKAMLMDLNLKP